MCLWYPPYRVGKAEFKITFQNVDGKTSPPLVFFWWRRKRTTQRQTMVLRIVLCDHCSKRLSWKLSVKNQIGWFPRTTLRGFGSQVVCVTHSCYITWAAWAFCPKLEHLKTSLKPTSWWTIRPFNIFDPTISSNLRPLFLKTRRFGWISFFEF